eukprot:m.358621 g.358621  ORF g.358621 m.358621 type:complete len:195 (+) comp18210_c0_seq1:201-785(+)
MAGRWVGRARALSSAVRGSVASLARAQARQQNSMACLAPRVQLPVRFSSTEAVLDETETAPNKPQLARRGGPRGGVVDPEMKHGIAHIKTSSHNTLVTITKMNGNVVCWSSAGRLGFKGVKQASSHAAFLVGERAAQEARDKGMQDLRILVSGLGQGRANAIKGLAAAGLQILSLSDNTPVPHNGCRPKKMRRM